ncbi:G-type lectin S-receptor-like serine/threonine-protein kinase SD2-2 [Prosopis cineraria]|uniref:G-type lectin S-receptor-like serine/threonine-protein kinase SD2-2 n=1 Tax=Prosopis cineraria TaxID=364024 RepID=UPI00241078D3|nr:G-type lectin S-receptor-like serine/threonine-protein kinase SD2-2 [Prosopis cineraria]
MSLLASSLTFFFLSLLAFPSSLANRLVLRGHDTLPSQNRTFELGFFTFNGGQSNHYYLAVRYASVPLPTYVWVANREKPSKNLADSTLEITETGLLLVKDSPTSILWQSTNLETSGAAQLKLLDSGNLILVTHEGSVSWQSFDFPTDAWLPGMNLTRTRSLVSWRSPTDPSPGLYSLRLRPPGYGEFELLFNNSRSYWTTGRWTGDSFLNIPEMMIPYLYLFHFVNPFTPTASFGFREKPLNGLSPPTYFRVEPYGQVRQYTWWSQAGSWNIFWSGPKNVCDVHGLCGSLGVCQGETTPKCECVSGFKPLDDGRWASGDYSGGCRQKTDSLCDKSDGFVDMGVMSFEAPNARSSQSKSRSNCETTCLSSCDCIGLSFDQRTSSCKNFYGSILNLHNSSSGTSVDGNLYVRVQREQSGKKSSRQILTGTIIGAIAFLGLIVATLLVLLNRRQKKKLQEDGFIHALNLQLFSYKELQLATRGFSEKVGHGGFGTVFQGELPDSTLVAVKRLERPGSGEKEFRAEVSTIGNIQHVNLVRLRGFCSENSHRLLVYELMPNGALSSYLRKEGGPSLSWEVRFRIAVGTAKGIAYLHEECRDCIIHCDIKPENILLDASFTAKVSDFGLAKLMGRDFSRVLATMRGTWGYVAPEWISGVAITTKADVYSYGMTLLELISGRRNVEAPPQSAGDGGCCEEAGEKEKWFFPPWAARQIIEGNWTAIVDKRLGNACNMEEVRRVAMVAVWCIQDDEGSRPSMGMVVKMLEGLVEVSVPPTPKLLQALVSGESFRGVKADSSTGDSLSGANADSESFTGAVSSAANMNVNVVVR